MASACATMLIVAAGLVFRKRTLQTGALGDAHARRVAAADAVLQPVLGSRAHQEARLTPSLRSLKLQEFREAAKNLGAA